MNSQLPIVERTGVQSCDNCAACCRSQGAPPDYVALSLNPHFSEDPSFAEDSIRLQNLPDEARHILNEYLLNYQQRIIPSDGPCVWLANGDQGCAFYEHRPSTCRVFEVASPGCLYYRKLHNKGELAK